MPFPRLRVRPRRSGLGRPTSQCRRRDHPGFRTLPRPFDSDSTRTERFDFILLESVNWEAADHHVRRTSSGECPPRTSTTRVSATSARCGFEPVCLCLRCDATYSELDILVVDSNSTRTESYVAIRPDPEAPSMVDVPKAADHNGYQQIMGPGLALRAGLKILVSAVAVLLSRCYLVPPRGLATVQASDPQRPPTVRASTVPREQVSENICYHAATIRCGHRPYYGPHSLGLFLLFPCGWSGLEGVRNAVVARASWP